MPSDNQISTPVKWLFLAAFTAAVLTGLSLLLARMDRPHWFANDKKSEQVRPSHVLGWEFIPGGEINARGMRGPEVSQLPAQGKIRILLIGDSFLESPLILEQLSEKAKRRGFSNLEFVRGGMSGYGTDLYLLWYRVYGRFLKPDLVLVFFFAGNDLANIVRSKDNQGYQKPYFLLENGALALRDYPLAHPEKRYPENEFTPAVQAEWKTMQGTAQALSDKQRTRGQRASGKSPLRMLYGIHYYLYAHFPPYHFVKDALLLAWEKRSPAKQAQQLALGDLWYLRHYAFSFFKSGKDLDAAWKLNDALFAQFAREVRQDGGLMVLCLAPHLWQVDKNSGERFVKAAGEAGYEVDLAAPNKRLNTFSKANRTPFLDPTAALRAAAEKNLPYDSAGSYAHWNQLGFETVSDEILKFLAAEKLLK